MELIIRLKQIREEPTLQLSGEVYQVWCAISRHSITHFHPRGAISHSSGQILPTLQVIYHQLHPNVVPSSRPQNRGETREEEQKHASEQGTPWRADQELPPSARLIQSPSDAEARYSKKKQAGWVG